MRDILGREGGQLLVKLLRDIVNKKESPPKPQRIDGGSTIRPAPMIYLEDAQFDPQKLTAEQAHRRWRAIGHQRPTSTFVEVSSPAGTTKRAVQLHDLQMCPQESADAVHQRLPLDSGSVICMTNPQDTMALFIRCSDGSVLCVGKIKPEGKPVLHAQAFWNGVQGKNKAVRFTGH